MNCVRFLVALLAVCILIMPAFSFEDKGCPISGQCEQKKCNFQKPCDNPKSMMGDDSKKIICECKVKEEKEPCDEKKTFEDQKSMMGDQGQCGEQKKCECQKPCDEKKTFEDQKSMMGDQGQCGVDQGPGLTIIVVTPVTPPYVNMPLPFHAMMVDP